ncbi:hypothetical protein L198_02819 [Cryptococcus wingfieldii CBS 7118]|uniref:Zn(2)-C6 fungal-type domain-containing protein n=1 Tax=Cryptococcus wingfieldii CBS 7118 TaxID=1295528 RepID=A0A1E3JMK1_9TREE|nr:hypothetical protein L198_02819 [Cryptococcus wingfieldii CBS 7118]ODO02088.1 hypothetical protein L198_02819 [Cryptococcus wingfieldii CBS 7118]
MVANAHPRSSVANPPKGRKIIRGIQLKRGSACDACRRRRVRCDAGKPHCASCVRSLQYLERIHPGDPHTIQCHYAHDWDTEDDGHSSQGEETDPRPRGGVDIEEPAPVHNTEGSLVSQENGLQSFAAPPRNDSHQTTETHSTMDLASIQGEQWGQSIAGADTMTNYNPALFSDFQSLFHMGNTPMDALASLQGQAVEPQTLSEQSSSGQSQNTTRPATVAEEDILDAAIQSSFIRDLLWPGWPATLPAPILTRSSVEIFFTTIPSITRVIHRQSFLARLSLPPTHPEFPHKSLLHAICTVASRQSAAVCTRTVQEDVEKSASDAKAAKGKGLDIDPESLTCFAEKHAEYALAAIKFNHVNARGLFDMLQAVIVLGHWGQSVARWMDCWYLVGTAARLATCLGLLDSCSIRRDKSTPYRRSILGFPKDDAEKEERKAAMWYLLIYDVTSSASSGWSGTLPMDEITTHFLAARVDFDRGGAIRENPQSFVSPDIYFNHPVVDSFVMLSKGNMLLSRVIKFVRRSRGMQAHERSSVADQPEFQQIENDLGMLSMTFPPSLRDPVQYMQGPIKTIDADLISAHLILHVAAIHLHEPFADIQDPTSSSANRLLVEARACLNIVYLIVSGSADVSYMVAPFTYLFTATRTLALFYNRALESQDEVSARTLYTEIAVFKNMFASLATRHAVGVRHLTMIDTMIASMEEEALGRPVVNGDISGLGAQASRSHFNSDPFSSRSNNSFHTASQSTTQEVPFLAENHPDALMINDLRSKSLTSWSSSVSGRFQDYLDQRRGYLKSSPNTSDSIPDVGSSKGQGEVPAPLDPLGWMDLKSIGKLGDPLPTSALFTP